MAAYHSRLSLRPSDNAIQAAVLVLLYLNEEAKISLVFIERVTHVKDRHSGQIAFPGGKMDPEDESIEACALREAYEEIGLVPSTVEILGRLSSLYIPVSNFSVAPVLAVAKNKPTFRPQLAEVAKILPTELAHFWRPSTLQKKDIKLQSGFVLKNVPFFDLRGNVLWGATAMILQELIDIIEEDL